MEDKDNKFPTKPVLVALAGAVSKAMSEGGKSV